jgi:NADPH2:quinone reductase
VCKELGDPADLLIEDVPPLEPAGPGRVVVDVKAAGVNFVDALFVRGKYQIKPQPPFTPGGEVAGIVRDAGDGVAQFQPGDRVIASCGLGAFAEQVDVSASSLYPLPEEIDFATGATLVQSYATALFCLERRTQLRSGEWVLILGAGGGVGRACVDVARHLGARTIGVASSEEKRQAALEAGAEATIDSTTEDVKTRARELSDGGVDVVVDPVGGSLAEPALRALKTYGRYLVVGFAAGAIPRLPTNQILLNNRSVIGVDWGAWGMLNPDDNRALVDEALRLVAEGLLRPAVPSVFPLERAGDVLSDLEERRIVGKVVLEP